MREEIEAMEPELRNQFKRFKNRLFKTGPYELKAIDLQETRISTSIYYEYCSGLTLHDRLTNTRQGLSISDTFGAIRGVLAYYQYYENRGGVFHHDIKLENIFIDQYSQIKVGGQDLAEFGGNWSTAISGCMSYIAPEVFAVLKHIGNESAENQQQHSITVKAEIFSLGILAIELLTGMSFHLNNSGRRNTKDPKNFLEFLHQMEDLQHFAQKALERVGLMTLSMNFYNVIKSMLEPNPENRCNFSFLYEYFGLRHQPRTHDQLFLATGSIGDKLSVLCDPNILQVTELRKLFFMRVDHEFSLIQFLICSSKEVWDLSNFDFKLNNIDDNLRSEFLIIACCLALRAMIYLDNLRAGIKKGVNIFKIKKFELYSSHAIYRSDTDHILSKVQFEENSKAKLYFSLILGQLEIQLSSHNATLERLKVYLLPEVSREEKLYELGEAAKLSIKAIVQHPALEVLQTIFEKFLRLIEDSFQEDSRFKFRQVGKGIFSWSEYIAERYPQLQSKMVFLRVTLPRTATN